MGRNIKEKDHNSAIFFRLRDEANWEIVDKLMTLPQYKKSRAKMLNDALTIGLPILLSEKCNQEITLADEPSDAALECRPRGIGAYENALDPRIDEVIRLLSEIIMNTELNRFMLYGLFNMKEDELPPKSPIVDRLKKGVYNHIPDCLFEKEIDLLKALPNKKEKK